eukprot:m.114164 g.114164  ORF g.114164 m.114164 type:complete len:739 (+) comp17117_c0_seq3:144-2360(+)
MGCQRGMWVPFVVHALAISALLVIGTPSDNQTDPANANLTYYQLFVLNQYDTCAMKASAQYTASCCSRGEVRKAIFQVPYSGISGQQTLVALAAAEGAVFAANRVSNASGSVPSGIGTTVAPNVFGANYTIEVAVAAAKAAGGSVSDQAMAAQMAQDSIDNENARKTGGKPNCTYPILIPAADTGSTKTGCSIGTFHYVTKNHNGTNSTFDRPCLPGFFCPPAVSCLIRCTVGAFCPGAGADGNGSLQGAGKEQTCSAGFFCPNQTAQQTCPANHFCQEGVDVPHTCNAFTICKTGTGSPSLNFTGAVMVSIIAGGLMLVLGLYENRRFWHKVVAPLQRRLGTKQYRQRLTDVTELVKLSLISTARLSDLARNEETTLEDEFHGDDDDVELLGTGCVEPKEYSITIDYEDLGLTLKSNGKVVLAGATGVVHAGKITAIMGPSGAGKSSFLSAITGKATYAKATGKIFINGREQPFEKFKTISGFVPQDDIMHADLKVREVLSYQAELRLPSTVTRAHRMEMVAYVIKLLGLEDVVDSVIGNPEQRGISGGQRKRVNIGMELVADPTFVALDEPTSGLDSTSSLKVLSALKKVATEQNLTILAVLHQPRYEIFSSFDDLLILGRGGYTAYMGATTDAVPYFQSLGFQLADNVNPADFLMDAVSGSLQSDRGTIDFKEEWVRFNRGDTEGNPDDSLFDDAVLCRNQYCLCTFTRSHRASVEHTHTHSHMPPVRYILSNRE